MSDYLVTMRNRVREIHESISRATNDFSDKAKVHCIPGCNECCDRPNVDVSILDCLPLAFYIVENGLAESIRQQAESRTTCPVLESHAPGRGRCGLHPHRPSLCRLFGFAAMKTKRSNRDLVACRKIHEQIGSRTIPDPPFMEEFSRQLMALDPHSGVVLLPIREAILQAIQKVETYRSYSS